MIKTPKIVLAPNAFKGSLTAKEVAAAMEAGFRPHFPHAQFVQCPVADGGEGSLDILLDNMDHGREARLTTTVTGPLGLPIQVEYGLLNDESKTAIIETAKIVGLKLVPESKRNPLQVSSFGIGELILTVMATGSKRIILTLGGSATCDCGIGALNALGFVFKDTERNTLQAIGENLNKITHIDAKTLKANFQNIELILVADVQSPLVGNHGALLYAPQKGATHQQMELLQQGFEHFGSLLESISNKSIKQARGMGAAGGIAAGLFALWGGHVTMNMGGEYILETIHFEEKIKNANLIVTGEGKIDEQTQYGKAPFCVAQLGKRFNIPVIGIAGQLGKGYDSLYDLGFTTLYSTLDKTLSLDENLRLTEQLLIKTCSNISSFLPMFEK